LKNLFIRTISGIILGLIAIFGVLYLPSPIFKGIIAFIVGLCVWEISNLLKKSYFLIKPVEVSLLGVISAFLLLFVDMYLSLFIWILYSFWYSHRVYNLNYLLALGFIFVYPLIFVSTIGFLHEINNKIILVLFATVWTGDTLAYFVGKSFGKTKLSPKLSPKKTWEGAIGSFLGSVVAGYLVSLYFNLHNAIFPVVLSAVFMQIGDLFESFIKRQVNVKDSSHIIPGHGGILDRIDGLIFASVVFYIFHRIFQL